MSRSSRLTPYRSDDAAAILDMLATGQPVAVVGLSNFGKSTLLRYMAEPEAAATYDRSTRHSALFVYVDCNRMLEMSAQGFYEVILRSILETLAAVKDPHTTLRGSIETYYHRIVESESVFAIPLAFNDALIALLDDQDERDVILLLDEFDTVLTRLDERVFLNMRALKDKYGERLNYVTATVQQLASAGGGEDLAEFLELFADFKVQLKPLNNADSTDFAAELFRQANDTLDPPERDYILEQAGGHPGLLRAVSRVVMEIEFGRARNLHPAGTGYGGRCPGKSPSGAHRTR